MLVREEVYRGFTVNIYSEEHDPGYLNPRTNQDNLGQMCCWHRRYSLGDPKHDFYNDPDGFAEWHAERERDIAIRWPLRLYDHSGISISLSSTWPYDCPWDSGYVGYIYVTKSALRKEYGCQRMSAKLLAQAGRVLKAEVEVYDQYLRGEIYWYSVDNEDGEVIDSCSGFYGWDNEKSGLMPMARDQIDCHIAETVKDHDHEIAVSRAARLKYLVAQMARRTTSFHKLSSRQPYDPPGPVRLPPEALTTQPQVPLFHQR